MICAAFCKNSLQNIGASEGFAYKFSAAFCWFRFWLNLASLASNLTL
ncbi:hypothetical protein CAMRE0001_3233 [Campylobacter rectus RM3267]|uniref:Uncharacterized protein n=1 Tax=Campylobacter rectus RM3267 TaxID=553218 RepID=B9D4Z1_CAMRE|nr:hypothetical protein CAMRE0001_3233 [Campylobacter rectus RM3267]